LLVGLALAQQMIHISLIFSNPTLIKLLWLSGYEQENPNSQQWSFGGARQA
jgi:hypothetical protein